MPIANAEAQQELQESKVVQVMRVIKQYNIEGLNTEKLAEAAIKGMLDCLDPHSEYLSPEDVAQMHRKLKQAYNSFGFNVAVCNDSLFVINLLPNGQAAKIGLQPGDCIVGVDNYKTNEFADLPHLVDYLIGKAESRTLTKLLVYRSGQNDLLDFSIESRPVTVSSIDYSYIVNDTICVVGINNLSENVADDFRQLLKGLRRKKLTTIIIDLRGNVGGYVSSAVDLAEIFLPIGSVVCRHVNNEGKTRTYITSYNEMRPNENKLVVVVDGNTASSSELFAAAMQDWDRAVIVGRPTFGKALTQKNIAISDGSELLLTTGYWTTPSGRSIQRPYDKGKAQYRAEVLKHYKDPSSAMPDTASKHYETKRLGRTVYAHCGVTPDVFIDRDTTSELWIKEQMERAQVFALVAARSYHITHGDDNKLTRTQLLNMLCKYNIMLNVNVSERTVRQSVMIEEAARAYIQSLTNGRPSFIAQEGFKYDIDIKEAIRSVMKF